MTNATLPEDQVQEEQEETNENWFKGNKDQLLFEILMEKWAK